MSRLDQRIERLETLSPAELRAEWQAVYGSAPPRLSASLLRLGIAYRLQEKAYGKLPARVAKALRSGKPVASPAPRSGTQYIRSWNGRTISVTVTEGGYRWEDRTYRSLSAIAREVTGAHWSGPRFFGIKARG